jgi:hypothetical protein
LACGCRYGYWHGSKQNNLIDEKEMADVSHVKIIEGRVFSPSLLVAASIHC